MAIPQNIVAGTSGDFAADHDNVFRKVGGQSKLAELIDTQGDGTVDPDILIGAERDATTEVLGHVEVQDALSVTPPYPRAWVLCAEWLTVHYCWIAGTQGQALPVHVKDEIVNIRQTTLPLIRQGKMGNVADAPPQANQVQRLVVHNSAFTLDRLKGLY